MFNICATNYQEMCKYCKTQKTNKSKPLQMKIPFSEIVS